MLVGREICHSGTKTSIERRSLKIIGRAAFRRDREGFVASRQHCDWSASSGAVKYLPEKCASAQPKPNRSELGECKRRLHTKASAASRRYREAYNQARREATTGTPEDCRTWMLNATIFRFGSSSYYFSSPARRSACVGTSSVDGMKGSFFLIAFRSTIRRLLDSDEHKGKASMEELFSSRGFYEHN